MLPLADGDIHVRRDGPRDAPALLLIHGSAGSTRSFDPLTGLLTGSHHVIRIDLSGCGRSAEPVDGDYDIAAQARRTGEVLDRLGAERAVVVGHSSGGYTATALAEQRPELVTAIALINTGPCPDALIATDAAPVDPARWPPTDEQIRQFGSTGFSLPGFLVPQELVDDARGMSFAAFAGTMRASNAYLAQRPIPQRLTDVAKPLLVIYGELDRRWRPESFADYRTVPDARLEPLAGVGHSPLLEDPPRTAAPLLAFTATRS